MKIPNATQFAARFQLFSYLTLLAHGTVHSTRSETWHAVTEYPLPCPARFVPSLRRLAPPFRLAVRARELISTNCGWMAASTHEHLQGVSKRAVEGDGKGKEGAQACAPQWIQRSHWRPGERGSRPMTHECVEAALLAELALLGDELAFLDEE